MSVHRVELNKAKLGMRRKLSKEVQTKLTRCCLFTLRHELVQIKHLARSYEGLE